MTAVDFARKQAQFWPHWLLEVPASLPRSTGLASVTGCERDLSPKIPWSTSADPGCVGCRYWHPPRVSSSQYSWVSLRNPARESAEVRISFDDNHFEGLDRRVVAFLRQSELDLRNFTKIDPSFTEEIEDARNRASRSLEKITEQKKATGDFAPVQITLNEYESILREIKNLDSAEDIADIQMRIRRNGLIANLKAYQPRVILASQR